MAHVTSKQVIYFVESTRMAAKCLNILVTMHIFDVPVAAVAACVSRWPISTATNIVAGAN